MARCFAAAIARYLLYATVCAVATTSLLQAETQAPPVTIRVANDAMERWPDGHIGRKATPTVWGFELGIVLTGVEAVWSATRDPKYFAYLQHAVDQFVQPDGTIATYDPQAYALNNILLGRELLLLYKTTQQEKYRRAAETLRQQIAHQPRTASGGLSHSQATGEPDGTRRPVHARAVLRRVRGYFP